MSNPDVIDQTAVDVATATTQFASYATPAKQTALQSLVMALGGSVDVQIQLALNGGSPELEPSEIISIITPLLATALKVRIRVKATGA